VCDSLCVTLGLREVREGQPQAFEASGCGQLGQLGLGPYFKNVPMLKFTIGRSHSRICGCSVSALMYFECYLCPF
jgi:hypothetical protein